MKDARRRLGLSPRVPRANRERHAGPGPKGAPPGRVDRMLGIRYGQGGDWAWGDPDLHRCFVWLRGRSTSFGGSRFSSHFGTPDFDIFLKSYLFPVEDSGVTEIVLDIHEGRQDRERLERRRALAAEAEHMEFLARCDRRRSRKKKRKR